VLSCEYCTTPQIPLTTHN